MSDQDIILEEGEEEVDVPYDLLKIIDSQVIIINECREWVEDMFDSMPEYRVKLALQAFRIIAKCQKKILDEL
jgi:hypothetical protein